MKNTFNLQQLVRPNVLNMQAYASARSEFTGVAEVYLDANENPYESAVNRYPDPLQKQLKEKIGTLKNVNFENIFLGNGSDEAIDLLIRIFCIPGKDEIICLPPTYGMYKVSATLSDVSIKTVPLLPDFQPNVNAILNAANTPSKLLFICNPNNPTGNKIDQDAIVQLLEKFPGIVVVDEAYIDFSTGDSSLSLLDRFPNLVVLQTFSKAWGLAGIRLGMAFASTTIIQLLNKVKPPYNINSLSQKAAINALERNEETVQKTNDILEQRYWLAQQLSHFTFVEKIYPSEANFLLVKVKAPKVIYQFLLQQNIIVRDRSTTLGCEGCLRFTIGTPVENQRLFIALKQYQEDNQTSTKN